MQHLEHLHVCKSIAQVRYIPHNAGPKIEARRQSTHSRQLIYRYSHSCQSRVSIVIKVFSLHKVAHSCTSGGCEDNSH